MIEFYHFASNFRLNSTIDLEYLESLPFTPISFPNVFKFKSREWIGYASKNESYTKFLLLHEIYPEASVEVANFISLNTGIVIDVNRLRLMSCYRNVPPHIDTPTNTRLFLAYKNSNASEYYTSNVKNIKDYVRDQNKKHTVYDGDLFFLKTDTLHETVQLDYSRKVYWFNYNFVETIDEILSWKNVSAFVKE